MTLKSLVLAYRRTCIKVDQKANRLAETEVKILHDPTGRNKENYHRAREAWMNAMNECAAAQDRMFNGVNRSSAHFSFGLVGSDFKR